MVFLSSFISPTTPPIPYLITAAVLSFAAASAGAFYFNRLRHQQNPEGKLKVGSFAPAKRYDDIAGEKRLVAIKYGVLLINDAEFPIQYEVIPQQVSIGGSFNPKPQRDITGGIIQGKTGVLWSEAEVPITDTMRGKIVEGTWKFEIKYGRPQKAKFTQPRHYRINLKFDPDGDVESAEPNEIHEA
jgi:hypothetical protein